MPNYLKPKVENNKSPQKMAENENSPPPARGTKSQFISFLFLASSSDCLHQAQATIC
jgi:hypothetical protein